MSFYSENDTGMTIMTCEYGAAVFLDASVDEPELKRRFQELSFMKLKQIHSNLIIRASTVIQEADGHWSQQAREALLIQTADCMPIVMLGPSTVVSLHAGWRGVEQNIVTKASNTLRELGLRSQDFYVFIGPHIKKESFEVDLDVAKRLAQSASEGDDPHSAPFLLTHRQVGKRYVDLDAIVRAQLNAAGFVEDRLWISSTNTFHDERYHSYRREKTPGRQWSFGYFK